MGRLQFTEEIVITQTAEGNAAVKMFAIFRIGWMLFIIVMIIMTGMVF